MCRKFVKIMKKKSKNFCSNVCGSSINLFSSVPSLAHFFGIFLKMIFFIEEEEEVLTDNCTESKMLLFTQHYVHDQVHETNLHDLQLKIHWMCRVLFERK